MKSHDDELEDRCSGTRVISNMGVSSLEEPATAIIRGR